MQSAQENVGYDKYALRKKLLQQVKQENKGKSILVVGCDFHPDKEIPEALGIDSILYAKGGNTP